MLWTIILVSLAALIALTFYKFIYKPKTLLKRYLREFSEKGYKVLNLDFMPFDTAIREITFSSVDKYQDCHHLLKTQWSKYDVILCNFIDRPYIQIVNPDLAKQFYELENEKNFKKYTELIRQLERMTGRSITFSEGAAWKHKRKVMTQFLNFSFIKSVSSKIEAICKRQIQAYLTKNTLKDQSKNGKPVSQIYLQEMIEMINSTVIAQIFFGGGNQKVDSIQIDGKSLPHFMRDLMDDIFWETVDPLSLILGVRFVQLGIREKDRKCNKKLKVFREFVTNFVHNRLYEIDEKVKKEGQIKEPNDLIEAFYLQAGQQGMKNSKKQFVDNMINDFANLYIAGTDTTQHATMMFIYYMNKYPQTKTKVIQEIKKHNVNVDQLSYESIKGLNYLEATAFESLRMYQTANGIFPRDVLQQVTIGGVKLEKETVVVTQTFPVHYSDDYYENSNDFKPERWLDADGKVKSARPFCFNTFSQGVRSCIGKQLALQEMKMFAVYFVSKFETEFETLDFKLNFKGFAYEPQPIKMKFWQKSST